MSSRALEYQVEVFAFCRLLLGKCFWSTFSPLCAEFERITLELVNVERRLALQPLASSRAIGELEVYVLGHLGRIDGDGRHRSGDPLCELGNRRETLLIEMEDVCPAFQLPDPSSCQLGEL